MKHIPFARVKDPGALLAAADGSPVWPVASDADLDALTDLASLFGAPVEEVGCTETACLNTASVGGAIEDVGSMCEACDAAASLYANLSQRRFIGRVGVDDLRVESSLAVVVACWKDLTFTLLEAVSAPPGRTVIGLIVSPGSGAELFRQALVRSAASRLGPSQDCRVVEANFLGGLRAAKSTQVFEALGAGAGVLNLITHSDGIDAYLGDELVLCPFYRYPAVATLDRAPHCYTSGFCHRREKRVEEAGRRGELIDPKSIRARLLVWNSCQGIRIDRGRVDALWGLAPILLGSATLGGLILTYSPILLAKNSCDGLLHRLEQGVDAGEALATFLGSPPATRLGYRSVLFGDPRLVPLGERAGEVRPEVVEPEIPARPAGSYDIGSERWAGIEFMRLCLTTTLASDGSKRFHQAAAETLKALNEYESLEMGKDCGDADPAAGQLALLRESFLRYCLVRDALYQDWLGAAIWETTAHGVCRCGACATPLTEHRGVLRTPGGGERKLRICPVCQVVGDLPDGVDLSLVLNESSVRIEGELPEDDWVAGIVTNRLGLRDVFHWPSDSLGRPVREFGIDGLLPERKTNVVFYIIHGTQIAALLNDPMRLR